MSSRRRSVATNPEQTGGAWHGRLLSSPWLLALLAGVLLLSAAAQAAAGLQRIYQRVAMLALKPVPSLEQVRSACGEDTLCAGRMLAQALGPRARLVRLRHPDTDAIRLVRVLPAITRARQLPDGRCLLRLQRFGIKAVREVRRNWQRLQPCATLVLDVRGNGGGNFARMLRLAALFAGPVPHAVKLYTAHGVHWLDLPALSQRLRPQQLVVVMDKTTASSAEVLAALLRRHAKARIVGRRSRGKNWLDSAVPLTHDWRLLVPSAIMKVPGETLAGGVRPDIPMRDDAMPR